MSTPSWLEFLASLGVNIEDIKAKWAAWQQEHPGESAPLSEIAGELFNGLSDAKIVSICTDAAGELVTFLTKSGGKITPGEDPSIFS